MSLLNTLILSLNRTLTRRDNDAPAATQTVQPAYEIKETPTPTASPSTCPA